MENFATEFMTQTGRKADTGANENRADGIGNVFGKLRH